MRGGRTARGGPAAVDSKPPSVCHCPVRPSRSPWTGSDPPRRVPPSLLALRAGAEPARAQPRAAGVEKDGRGCPERILSLGFERWGEGMLRGCAEVLRSSVGSIDEGRLPCRRSARRRLSVLHESAVASRSLPKSQTSCACSRPGRHPIPAASPVAGRWPHGARRHSARRCPPARGRPPPAFRGRSWRRVCYWSPRYVAPAASTPAEAAVTRAAAHPGGGGTRRSQGPTGVLLSGGLDSSTIAAVASRLDPPRGSVTRVLTRSPRARRRRRSL